MLWRFVIYFLVFDLAVLLAYVRWAMDTQTFPASSTPSAVPADAHARKLLMQYCGSCHEGGRTNFDFDETSLEPAQMQRYRAAWELAAQKLRDYKMPPDKATQPSEGDREAILQWLEESVLKSNADTGRLRARRLQKAEYLNVVRDLFGRSIKPAAALPDDEVWTACQDVPDLAPEHLNQYRSAAKQILGAALAKPLLGSAADADEDEEIDVPVQEPSGCSHGLISESTGKTAAESARDILASFARRAYRGPVGAAELDRLVTVFEHANASGAAFEESFSAACEEVLISPRFLYRVETRDEDPKAPTVTSGHEFGLATRLSFFLWNSAPDDELLDHAQAGTLRQNLETQIIRLLRDPRSKALAKGFANFWLGLDRLDAATIDENFRRGMKKETRLFVAAIVREDRSVLEFLDTDYTYLNEALAKHYGITGVYGDRFRRVSLNGTGRGGLLTQASVLALTAKSDHTSPVIRGKWVLENLLGESISSPRPEVVSRGEPPSQPGTNVFQNPTCAQCHARTDPIGYTLENFDALGRWRSKYANAPIDPTGVLPDGETLHRPEGLKAYLLKHHKQFVRALSERLLAYALGRKLTDHDRAALVHIPDRVAAHEFRFSRVALEVARSEPFLAGRRDMANK